MHTFTVHHVSNTDRAAAVDTRHAVNKNFTSSPPGAIHERYGFGYLLELTPTRSIILHLITWQGLHPKKIIINDRFITDKHHS